MSVDKKKKWNHMVWYSMATIVKVGCYVLGKAQEEERVIKKGKGERRLVWELGIQNL